jgi:hypothetical protein
MRLLVHRRRERLGEARLARARSILQQHMAFREHRRQHERHDLALAHEGLVDVVDQSCEGALEPGRLFGGHRHRDSFLFMSRLRSSRYCQVRRSLSP